MTFEKGVSMHCKERLEHERRISYTVSSFACLYPFYEC